ncbi:Glutamate racemase [Romboutsia hominis]|uniref:Glutamate racemase n=2 Tax=Peptostreptococcaceae TaxID=186804 RepID=A0A2P2BV42_9FIRM|nr:glutamate racemase [Romboutsia hominis]CEI74231.1 Glutamate racemase [Romboutsia hominis]
MMSDRPIGVFDSGLGGLTVLKEIMKILPNENIIYFGDTARVPYGPRSKDTVMKYTFQAINFLISKGVKAIVIACNTATARCLKEANEKYDIPIIGVIEAGARTAAYSTKNKIVGVIGTEGTVRSKTYNAEIAKIDKDIKIIDKACNLFVPIVEEGWANTEIARLTAEKYLEELVNEGIDSLVLGCTHYPILKRTIGEYVGEDIKLVNPAKETAMDLKKVLEEEDILRKDGNERAYYEYYVSDIPEKFASIATEFIKRDIDNVNHVEIQKY